MQGGSSPRVRGKLVHAEKQIIVTRIIPARAGQTPRTARTPYPTSDHPRACGANDNELTVKNGNNGSSPRVRGKPDSFVVSQIHKRIIPARAGQTVASATPHDLTSDHPRACGANSAVFLILSMEAGSSPRVRGKRGLRR